MQRRSHCQADISGAQLFNGFAGDHGFAITAKRSQPVILLYSPAVLLTGYVHSAILRVFDLLHFTKGTCQGSCINPYWCATLGKHKKV